MAFLHGREGPGDRMCISAWGRKIPPPPGGLLRGPESDRPLNGSENWVKTVIWRRF